MSLVYGNSCLGGTMITGIGIQWKHEAKQRAIELITPEFIQKVKEIVIADACLKNKHLAEIVGLSVQSF